METNRTVIRQNRRRGLNPDIPWNSVTNARDEVVRLLRSLDHVLDGEYTIDERAKLIGASRRYCYVLRPIVRNHSEAVTEC